MKTLILILMGTLLALALGGCSHDVAPSGGWGYGCGGGDDDWGDDDDNGGGGGCNIDSSEYRYCTEVMAGCLNSCQSEPDCAPDCRSSPGPTPRAKCEELCSYQFRDCLAGIGC